MVNNRLYRNFVILQEDERGYSNAEDKTLSGYSKIEAKGDKCKISFYAQNLRKDNDNYYMMIICCKKDAKQIVNLGPVEISPTGKGEATKEYNIANIGGVDVSFDKICGTAIAKFDNGVPIFVMCGFLNGQQPSENWKNYKIVKCNDAKGKYIEKKDDKEQKKEYKKSDKSKTKKVDEREKVKIEEKNEIEEQAKVEGEEQTKLETKDLTKEIDDSSKDVVEEENYTPKENLRGKFEEYEEEIENTKPFDPNNSRINGSIGEYFEAIVEGFERDYDSIQEIKYTKWYKIPVHDLHEMCNMSNYNKYTLAYYPMLNYYPYIKKYGYFMLGYKCDSTGNLKHIIYGVPGKKDKDEQPYDGRTGFVTWVDLKDNNNGCWLMFYDFKNSTVVVPMQQ